MSEKIPRVSVVIPVYNGEKFLEETITSVLNQTFTDYEVILVNDASKDRSQDIINRLVAKHPQCTSVTLEKNEGLAAARNTGIRQARGDLIALLDCDDIWLPDHLKEAVNYLDQHPEAGGCSCYADRFDHLTGETLNTLMPQPENQIDALLLHEASPISQPSAMVFRKEVTETIGLYDEELRFTEDWEFHLRLAKHYPIGVIDKILIRYRVHGDSLSHQIDRNRRYSFISLEKVRQRGYFRSASFYRKCKARAHLIYAGSYYHHTNRRLPILKELFLAFLADPMQVIHKLYHFFTTKRKTN